ncbi:hypothetical protein Peur_047129 [Populus x canadensis]
MDVFCCFSTLSFLPFILQHLLRFLLLEYYLEIEDFLRYISSVERSSIYM